MGQHWMSIEPVIGVTSHVGRVDSLLVQAGGRAALSSAGDGGRDDAARQAGGQNLFLVSIVRALFNSFIQHVNTTHHLSSYLYKVDRAETYWAQKSFVM